MYEYTLLCLRLETAKVTQAVLLSQDSNNELSSVLNLMGFNFSIYPD